MTLATQRVFCLEEVWCLASLKKSCHPQTAPGFCLAKLRNQIGNLAGLLLMAVLSPARSEAERFRALGEVCFAFWGVSACNPHAVDRPTAPRPKFLRRTGLCCQSAFPTASHCAARMFQKKRGCFLRRRRKGKKIFRL